MLGKLHIPPPLSDAVIETMKTLLDLVTEAQESKIASEASTRNVLTRFNTNLTKLIGTAATSADNTAEVGSGSGSGTEKADGEVEEDMTVLTTTEAPQMETEKPIKAEPEDEEDEEGDISDITMTTNFVPDAEGTRIMNLVDEEDDFDDEDTVIGKGEKRSINDESLLDSLLDSEADV